MIQYIMLYVYYEIEIEMSILENYRSSECIQALQGVLGYHQ